MTAVRRGLVLGCGGVAGAAWSIAVLAELERQLGWRAGDAQVLIGTSAGAVLAALLGAGVEVDRMQASQRGEAVGCAWDHARDNDRALPPWPAPRFPCAHFLWHGLRGRLPPMTALSGLLPQGRGDLGPLLRLVDSVVPAGDWVPHPRCWMMVVDVATGARVALGREDAPPAPLNLAVAASYAIPGWYPPQWIGGRRYLDGGAASPTSADRLIDSGIDEAIIIAPMASRAADPRGASAMFERLLRRTMTAIVDREVAALQAAGIRVIRIEPGSEDLAAFGLNMMDPRRRLHVVEVASRTAPAVVASALAAG